MERLTLKQAYDLLLARVSRIEEWEEIPLWDAAGRVLAEEMTAERDQPPFSRSPLDGYAVRSVDIQDASYDRPVELTVIDEVTAGYAADQKVAEGTAIRIMTGAPIPDGADCIIGQEDTDYGEDVVNIYTAASPWKNYCFQGEDYTAGTVLLPAGTVLGAVETGVAASAGRSSLNVCRKPAAAVICTGDELVLPGQRLTAGKIYDSNLYTLAVRLACWNVDVVYREHAIDDALLVAERIKEIADDVDIIITTGGVSVGKKDIMHDVINLLGAEKIFWKIAIKPGMPTLCAQYKNKLIICLSGNPYGAAVNLELLVRPLIAEMSGRGDLQLRRVYTVSESAYPKRSTVTRYVRACYNGETVRISDGSNDSGILSTMCGCNCLIELPAGTERLNKGDKVWIILL
jgi:molybdopterin molybdotransferase